MVVVVVANQYLVPLAFAVVIIHFVVVDVDGGGGGGGEVNIHGLYSGMLINLE